MSGQAQTMTTVCNRVLRSSRHRLPAVLAGLMIMSFSYGVRADCNALIERTRAEQGTNDVAALKASHAEAARDGTCNDAARLYIGRAVVRATERAVIAGASGGRSLASFEADIAEALRYAPGWRLHAWLGDIARERRDHGAAAQRYQEALRVINDEAATPKPPEEAVIADIFNKAQQSVLAADEYVATTTRSGEPGGLMVADYRGFRPTKVALPIEFKYDSTEFTAKGRTAADDLLATVRVQAPASITLVGHTDSRGAADYNQRLSQRRADAVAAFLQRGGYGGTIQTIGRGLSDPMVLDDPKLYTPEQVHQINRRVEVRR